MVVQLKYYYKQLRINYNWVQRIKMQIISFFRAVIRQLCTTHKASQRVNKALGETPPKLAQLH